MTEHTSGKWKVFDAYDVMGKPGLVAASRIGAVTDDGIETVVKASCYGYDEINMTKADAHLIAAAPVMYDYIKIRAEEGDERAEEIMRLLS